MRQATLHKLSTRQVQTADAGDHGDGGGLVMRITAEQSSWVFRYTSPSGKRREMGLGACERSSPQATGASLRAARTAAAAARAMLAEVPPRDPIDERDRAREAARSAEVTRRAVRTADASTLARVARTYHGAVVEGSRSGKHAADWINSLERHVPPDLWRKPIGAITAPELLDALIPLFRALPETASRVRQRLEAVFDDAIFRGLCAGNPAGAIRRKITEAKIDRKVEPHRALPYLEVPAFIRQLQDHAGIAALALRFGILTAARTAEIIGATWAEIDEPARLWIVPAERMKGKEAHRVPLTAPAVKILARQRELGSEFLFPSPRDMEKPLSNIAMLKVLERMDYLKRTTVHGVCRASFSTWANETGAARPDVIEACLAHREADRVAAAYNRAQFNAERRILLDTWALFLNDEQSATASGNVVPLRA
jgi:integrase